MANMVQSDKQMQFPDRGWMYSIPRMIRGDINPIFCNKIDEFIEFAQQHPYCMDHMGNIRCPCKECRNMRFLSLDEVKTHLVISGFVPLYYNWTSHGEEQWNIDIETIEYDYTGWSGSGSYDVGGSSHVPCTRFEPHMEDELDRYWMMIAESVLDGQDQFNETPMEEEPNYQSNKFFDKLKTVDQKFFPGCDTEMQLSFNAQMLNIKTEGKGGSDIASSWNSSSTLPLGLTLHITQPFINACQRSVHKLKDEKFQAANLPATFLQIGDWKWWSNRGGDLTAKIYYAKRKLIWEVLHGLLKYKIEMDWSHISSIRAVTPNNMYGTLELELKQPPQFFKETKPKAQKHTMWDATPDFTMGAASLYRKHIVSFQAGILDEPYAKLLLCDQRLSELSPKPFPEGNPTFLDHLFRNTHEEFSLYS